jgi:hypothetical protein
VHFAVCYLVTRLGPISERTFQVGAHEVTIRPLGKDECRDVRQSANDGFCQCELQKEVTGQFASAVNELSHGNLPAGSSPSGDEPWLDDSGKIRQSPGNPPLAALPQHFQSEVLSIFNGMRVASEKTVDVYRWRSKQLGPHQPLTLLTFVCSPDGDSWTVLPDCSSRELIVTEGFKDMDDQMASDVQSLLATGRDQPFAWSLLNEAWGLRVTDHRSSLMLGVAAAEIGFKSLVAELVPAAAWLVWESPSPPLTVMLKRYLPTLPAKLKIDGKVLPPPKSLMNQLQRGIELRNKVSHSQTVVESADLFATLESILDLLWLLDYFRGIPWALDMLHPNIRAEMGLPELPPTLWHYITHVSRG